MIPEPPEMERTPRPTFQPGLCTALPSSDLPKSTAARLGLWEGEGKGATWLWALHSRRAPNLDVRCHTREVLVPVMFYK